MGLCSSLCYDRPNMSDRLTNPLHPSSCQRFRQALRACVLDTVRPMKLYDAKTVAANGDATLFDSMPRPPHHRADATSNHKPTPPHAIQNCSRTNLRTARSDKGRVLLILMTLHVHFLLHRQHLVLQIPTGSPTEFGDNGVAIA